MAHDPIVTRRFSELAAKADTVAQQKKYFFISAETSRQYFSIPSGPFKEWGQTFSICCSARLEKRAFTTDTSPNIMGSSQSGNQSSKIAGPSSWLPGKTTRAVTYSMCVPWRRGSSLGLPCATERTSRRRLQGPSLYPGSRRDRNNVEGTIQQA